MQEELLREIANQYLVPLFSGAYLTTGLDKKSSSKRVAWRDPMSIAFKVERGDNYRLILTRPQRFAQPGEVTLTEYQVVQAFVDIVGGMAPQLATDLRHDLLSTFQRRVVARAVQGEARESLILNGIDRLAHWGNRLYEGAPISASIGFRNLPQTDGITLEELSKEEFGAVISNGFDTLLEFDFAGQLISHQSNLAITGVIPSYCPLRQAYIAEWTTKKETRVALSLNRLGEVLIFRNQELLFARRSGQWHFLTHDPVIMQMGIPKDPDLRKVIYETCLDASFARTGACIGVVGFEDSQKWREVVVHKDDYLSFPTSTKAKTLKKIIGTRSYMQLDRRLRQELAAIDGATVLSHTGQILAIGAILKIDGGSTGGGRLAAAKALSKVGLGIKVSQDGSITGFRKGRKDAAFKVM
ncbi:hypothetical protein [Brevundimonas sp.]|uniref:hypothetical protein n=1 Tax=Brevundimonas sp. TaxID=1871086 RepID=UPI0027379F01|nr:hypothetical protein [Brevundimonas sp.]MDP3800573.1 hypothetical protein [Brevundimonas sp.]